MWELLAVGSRAGHWVFVIAGLVAVVACVWLGWKNLEQSKLLTREIPPSRLRNHVGEVVTVRGRPESLYTGSDPFFSNWIWFQKRFQQRDSYGRRRNRSWRTVRQDNSPYGLRLTLSDSSTLLVRNDVPTETYGTVKETQGGGFGASSRVLLKYYSTHTPFLTVCGRLEDTGESLMLVKDKRMGFLLSIHTGADQAKIETTKAWLGLAAAPLGYLAALAYFLSQ